MAKKKQTKTEQNYKKEWRRISRFIKSAEKRGYTFPDNVLPEKPKNPTRKELNQLKKITPQQLYKKATYKKGTAQETTGTEGRTIERKAAATRGARTRRIRKAIQEEAERIEQEYWDDNASNWSNPIRDEFYRDNPEQNGTGDGGEGTANAYKTLEYIKEELEVWEPMPYWSVAFADVKRRDKTTLSSMLNGRIAEEGEEVVAKRLQENAERVTALIDQILYGSGSKEYDLKTGRDSVNFAISEMGSIIKGGALTADEARDLQDMQEMWENDY